ncbi:MAG: hypothetical protein ACMZI0_12125 [Symbiopectobacterium sp.]|uniref:hypothetical protein n=1 Tax=Symbiopectobacterium sp. TaxID=2952789 RepID=UPI0039EB6F79
MSMQIVFQPPTFGGYAANQKAAALSSLIVRLIPTVGDVVHRFMGICTNICAGFSAFERNCLMIHQVVTPIITNNKTIFLFN